MDTDREYIHKELTGEIIAAAFNVHNALGCGLLEKVYENALSWELELMGKRVVTQKEFKVIYRDKEVGFYFADLIVEDKVIVEVKVVESLAKVRRAQLLNCLKIMGLKVGLLFNFTMPRLAYERLIS
jgi:GxxExxY protein